LPAICPAEGEKASTEPPLGSQLTGQVLSLHEGL
jgi:hypothetical protein